MPTRVRALALPELFLGLLSIGIAVVVTAKIVAGTIHDARHIRDTISVTGSARKPIDSDLVAHGLGGKLGPMRRTELGVYQITPRDSTEVSDYGINDTTSREKDVNAVVTATFAVKH